MPPRFMTWPDMTQQTGSRRWMTAEDRLNVALVALRVGEVTEEDRGLVREALAAKNPLALAAAMDWALAALDKLEER